MANLKALRIRINSVRSTRKITSAMRMVASSKLRRAQTAAEAARPYAAGMEEMLANIAASMRDQPGAPPLLTGRAEGKTHLLIVATAERGLCGGFNSSITRLARQRIDSLRHAGQTVKVLTVGRKGRDALRTAYGDLLIGHVDLSGVRKIGFGEAVGIARQAIEHFEASAVDNCSIFFSRFKSVMSQTPTEQQLIPAPVPEDASAAQYEYEEDEAAILEELLPRNIAVQIFAALLENAASEQGARMTAMDNATRNAGKMIDRLTIEYNRSRQAAITTELIEIISGAEAL